MSSNPITNIFKSKETIQKEEDEAIGGNWQPKDIDAGPASSYDDHLPPTILRPADFVKVDTQRVRILYNPKSGEQKGTDLALKAKRALENNAVEIELIALEHEGHAEELTLAMDLTGIDVLAVLGGDGTFHECVNGMMKRKDDARKKVPIVMIPAGTGNSFSLELFNSIDMRTVLQRVKRGLAVPIDVSHITFTQNDQKDLYLFNSLHWGMASKVLVTAEKMRWMGNAIRYTTAALVEIFKGKKTRAIVKGISPGGVEWSMEDEYSVCIANMIQTAAKGMKLAPDAKLNDGCIDIILIKTSNTFNLANIFQKFYDGTHTDLDYVEYKQCREFSITPLTKQGEVIENTEDDAEQVLDIDGELKGIAPFVCKVIEKAVLVII